jgi:hypothetical protein
MTIGHNQPPDRAQQVMDRLALDYKATLDNVAALLDEARKMPATVETDEQALLAGALVKRMREAVKSIEDKRVLEKEPHLRAEEAVDQFFFPLRDKLARRTKTAAAGGADILDARTQDYLVRKQAAEQAERDRAAAEQRRLADARQAEADRLEREASEAREAAGRARAPSQVEAKGAIAEEKERQLAEARAEAAVAAERAEDARIATLEKPADVSRVAGGNVSLSLGREKYAIVTDRALLDYSKLAPFFTDVEVEKALRGWAKSTFHREKMGGAEVGERQKGVTR